MDVNQIKRFSEVELELIRKTFKAEENILTLRKVFFQRELTDKEKEFVTKLTNEQKVLIKKALIPEMTDEAPLLQQVDMYFNLGEAMKTLNPMAAELFIRAKDLQHDYMLQQFYILSGLSDVMTISYKNLRSPSTLEGKAKTEEERWVEMKAYLDLSNSWIESAIVQLKTLANQEVETPSEILKKNAKNSNK